MILERIIGYLDGISVECCLKISPIWFQYFHSYFNVSRVQKIMKTHFKEFVPVQTEIW